MRIKIALAQMEVTPGRPRVNLARMLEYIDRAKERAADIVVFPELSVTGSLLGDLWGQEWFLRECEACGQDLLNASDGITVIFGSVAVDWQRRGADGEVRRYNACFAARDKKWADNQGAPYHFYIKDALSARRDEYRYFCGNRELALETGCRPDELIKPFTVTIGDDKILLGCLIGEDCRATTPVDLLVNISSDYFAAGSAGARRALLSGQAGRYAVPVVYINHTGVQNNGKNIYTYAGAGCAFNPSGVQAAAFPFFADGLFFLEYDRRQETFLTKTKFLSPDIMADGVAEAVIYGAARFLAQCRISKMTVGLSGGIDSAVSAALYTHILGGENVLLLNMPSCYNSGLTIDLAARVAGNLGAYYASAPIGESVELTVRQISGIRTGGRRLVLSPLDLENAQARDRSSRLLAAAAAAFGGGFSCNSNKSELTVGYGTFYGDLAGLAAPLGDLWKHQVYSLGRYLNEVIFQRAVIPEEVFNIMPSAELSACQTVGTGGDPLCYPYHDYLFKAFVERNLSPLEIAVWYRQGRLADELGCSAEIIDYLFPERAGFFADLERWWLAARGLAVAKRIQAPPVVTVSARAFGLDYREAQLPGGLPAEYLLLKRELLQS